MFTEFTATINLYHPHIEQRLGVVCVCVCVCVCMFMSVSLSVRPLFYSICFLLLLFMPSVVKIPRAKNLVLNSHFLYKYCYYYTETKEIRKQNWRTQQKPRSSSKYIVSSHWILIIRLEWFMCSLYQPAAPCLFSSYCT